MKNEKPIDISEMTWLMDELQKASEWNPTRRRNRVLQVKEIVEDFLFEVAGTSAGRASNVVEVPKENKELYEHALELRTLMENMASLAIDPDDFLENIDKATAELKMIFEMRESRSAVLPYAGSTFESVKVPAKG